jgi:malonyl-CoA O-methyltransferase
LGASAVKLPTEFLPATGAARQSLVLLHGWGSTRDVWRPLLPALRRWADVTLVDLPGLAPVAGDDQPELDAVLEAIAVAAPPQACYLGWSLGGQLAAAFCARHPERVIALVTLCSNPCFVAQPDWPGMPAAELADFRDTCRADPQRTLRRFDSLQVAGAASPRPLWRQLQAGRASVSGQILAAGLDWLGSLDLRATLVGLRQPQLHLLGSADGLLPAALPGALADLLAQTPEARVEVLEACPHPAPLAAVDAIATHVHGFLARAGCLGDPATPLVTLSKQDVAASFSRAAPRYDSVAVLQREVGEHLLGYLDPVVVTPARVVDLGSGTGHFAPLLRARFPDIEYLGLDLAEGMCRYARDQHPGAGQWLVADAESLPLAATSVDLVFSSLAIQWCQRPEALFAELSRVLRPGGRCVFTTLGPGTLNELRAAWREVDPHRHVNDFLPVERLEAGTTNLPDLALTLAQRDYRMDYDEVRELLDELKTLGAHNVSRERPAGLGGRRALLGMLRAYEQWRDVEGRVPATYEVIFGVLEKR